MSSICYIYIETLHLLSCTKYLHNIFNSFVQRKLLLYQATVITGNSDAIMGSACMEIISVTDIEIVRMEVTSPIGIAQAVCIILKLVKLRTIFSMSRNIRSQLTPTEHTYTFITFSDFYLSMFLNLQIHLKCIK